MYSLRKPFNRGEVSLPFEHELTNGPHQLVAMALAKALLIIALISGCSAPNARSLANDLHGIDANSQTLVREGEVFLYALEVKNDVGRARSVATVSASCGCLISEDLPRLVDARGEINIPIRFESKGKSGYFTAEVLVGFADGEVKTHRKYFYVVSDTLPDVHFGKQTDIDTEKPVAFSIDWSDLDDRILELNYNESLCSLEIIRRESTKYTMAFLSKEGLPDGKFEVPVTIVTDGKKNRDRVFLIVGHNPGMVEAREPTIGLGLLSDNGP